MSPVTPPIFSACEVLGAAEAVADRGEHEVFEHLDVFGVDDLGRDPHRLQLARAGDDHLHHPATRRSLDRGLRERLLRRGHVGLHLLDLLHHLVDSAGAASRPLAAGLATLSLRHRAPTLAARRLDRLQARSLADHRKLPRSCDALAPLLPTRTDRQSRGRSSTTVASRRLAMTLTESTASPLLSASTSSVRSTTRRRRAAPRRVGLGARRRRTAGVRRRTPRGRSGGTSCCDRAGSTARRESCRLPS